MAEVGHRDPPCGFGRAASNAMDWFCSRAYRSARSWSSESQLNASSYSPAGTSSTGGTDEPSVALASRNASSNMLDRLVPLALSRHLLEILTFESLLSPSTQMRTESELSG